MEMALSLETADASKNRLVVHGVPHRIKTFIDEESGINVDFSKTKSNTQEAQFSSRLLAGLIGAKPNEQQLLTIQEKALGHIKELVGKISNGEEFLKAFSNPIFGSIEDYGKVKLTEEVPFNLHESIVLFRVLKSCKEDFQGHTIDSLELAKGWYDKFLKDGSKNDPLAQTVKQ